MVIVSCRSCKGRFHAPSGGLDPKYAGQCGMCAPRVPVGFFPRLASYPTDGEGAVVNWATDWEDNGDPPEE